MNYPERRPPYAKVISPADKEVNRPAHYTAGTVECIDAMESSMTEEQFIGAMKYQIGKYMWRWDTKGVTDDLDENEKSLVKLINLGKAEFHLMKLKALMEAKIEQGD